MLHKRMQNMYLDIFKGCDPYPRWITEANLRAMWDYLKSDQFLHKLAKVRLVEPQLKVAHSIAMA